MSKSIVRQSPAAGGLTLAEAARRTLAQAEAKTRPALLICDVSGSMRTADAPGGRRRVDALGDVVARLRAEYPALKVIVFASSPSLAGRVLPEPDGGTALHLALDFARPMVQGETPVCLISDGEPDDQAAALAAARRFPAKIQVFYVGPEGGAGEWFLAELSALTGGQYRRVQLGQALLGEVRKAVAALPPGRK